MPAKTMSNQANTAILVDSLRFPESPRWHEGRLWCCDYVTRKVMSVDLQGGVQTIVELPDLPSALGWAPDGQMLIVSGRNRRLLRLEGNKLAEVADMSGLVSSPCADMVIDRQGRAYIGNVGYDFGNPQAAPLLAPILLVTSAGSVRVVADRLAFPNGMVITPDDQTLIVAESQTARLTAFHIESDGSLSDRRIWAQFDDGKAFESRQGRVTPDGICLDSEGAVWAASPGTKQVLRVREGGEITHRIPVDAIPLACMLGGPKRRTLFMATTASLDFRDRQAAGRIETMQVDVPGAGLP